MSAQPSSSLLGRMFITGLGLVLLSACGGGGGGGNPVGPSGQAPGTPLGRLVSLVCGTGDGANTEYREYLLHTRGAGDTIEVAGSLYSYSAPNCGGSRDLAQPENNMRPGARMTSLSEERSAGLVIRRYQNDVLGPQEGQVNASIQVAYTTMPNGDICAMNGTETLSTARIAENMLGLTGDSYLDYCWTWEALDGGLFKP